MAQEAMKGCMIRWSWSSNMVTDSNHRTSVRDATVKLLTCHSDKSTEVLVNRRRPFRVTRSVSAHEGGSVPRRRWAMGAAP